MSEKITPEEVRKVAELARLQFNDDELAAMTEQMGQILEYVEVLGEVDTDEVDPMAHAVDLHDVFRPDVVQEPLPRDEALANAPKNDGKYFIVPAILDTGD